MEKFNLIPKFMFKYRKNGHVFYARIFAENKELAKYIFDEYYLHDEIIEIESSYLAEKLADANAFLEKAGVPKFD